MSGNQSIFLLSIFVVLLWILLVILAELAQQFCCVIKVWGRNYQFSFSHMFQ
ncbi:hypothetical protein Ptr902_00598 [Pyrenophora tritici-repentis]|nr:hypothetical protein Ptr902_00598 [Pyrenophora tritici-repentis]